MRKKIVAIEQDFEKIKIYVTGKDNFLHTRVIETYVYELAELLLKFKTENMDNEKIYVLQIDLPDGGKVGDEYKKVGNDQYRNIKFINDKCPVIEDVAWFSWQVEENETFFKLKEEEKSTVVEIKENYHFGDFVYRISGVKELFTISKERLAEILIAESKGDLNLNGNTRIKFQPIESSDPDFNRYNEKELIEAEEKAFNMARSVYPHKYVYAIKDWQYKTFSDYKNQQSNK